MKATVISYSLTGNNDMLAKSVAKEINAEHIRIREATKRGNGRIALDMLLNRNPKVDFSLSDVDREGTDWMRRIRISL